MGASDGIFPRTKKQSTGLLVPALACRRPVQIPTVLKYKKCLVSKDTRHFSYRSDGIRTHGLLVPNQARYQLRYTPERKNRSSRAAAVWLGMRGSNSHGRSQSPLHYHYANPHRICVVGVCPQRSYIIACGEPFVNSYFKLFCKNPQKP